MKPNQQAMVVVLEHGASDSQAALIRSGLRAFDGVARVIPVNGLPTDTDAIAAIRRDVMGESFAELEFVKRQRDELASRMTTAQDALSGPIPMPGRVDRTEWVADPGEATG